MSIHKKIRNAILLISLLALATVLAVSAWALFNIQSTFDATNKQSSAELYATNVEEVTKTSTQIATSLASYYAQTVNINFERIMGELNTLRGGLEAIYKEGGTVSPQVLRRTKEYVISEAAQVSEEEERATLAKLSGATPLFDNILRIEPHISLAYLVLENGMVISSTDTFYPAVEAIDMRTRDWYKDTVARGSLSWSSLYDGMADGRKYVTCSVPFHGEDGALLGVIAFDLRVSEISEKTLAVDDASFISAYIMDRDGTVLLSNTGVDEVTQSDEYRRMIRETDLETMSMGYFADDESIVGFAQIESTDWLLVTSLDYDQMMRSVRVVGEAVQETSDEMSRMISSHIKNVFIFYLIIALVAALSVLLVSRALSRSITRPIQILTDGAKELGSGNLDVRIMELGDDEIGMLAQTMNNMTVQLKQYIDQVAKAAGEKQRLESELDVARDIQLGMLPGMFELTGYDIAGTMIPAKEVGGDFYDFFMIGEDKLCLVVADVSGKGVGAALFMTISKMIIKTAAQNNHTASELLILANEILCEQNPASLFVTVFLAILDIHTGEIDYSCAGHNPPVMCRQDGTVEFLPVACRLPLAGMSGIEYVSQHATLAPGEDMILYTDGVTEATNHINTLYGDNRLLGAVRALRPSDSRSKITSLKHDIDVFVGDAEQFDDITLVVIHRAASGGSEHA